MTKAHKRIRSMYSESAWQLVAAAEKLFGNHGVDNVSLREIAAAAGHANNSAVQYHFGSKENLVQAVFEIRMPALDAARARYVEEAGPIASLTPKELFGALLIPVAQCFRGPELETFGMFMTSLAHRDTDEHPFFRNEDIAPVTIGLYRAIEERFAHLPYEAFSVRLRLAVDLFFDAIAEQRRLGDSPACPYRSSQHFWYDILDMVVAVMQTPFTSMPPSAEGS